jgi:ankyrin repeat protein
MGGSSPAEPAALELDRAFRDGDLDAIRVLLGDPGGFPNVSAGVTFGSCLTYAIAHGPASLVSMMLELGADPNVDDGDGFPPLIAALTGASAQADVVELVEDLIAHGADVDQRGVNGYAPLHIAAEQGDLAMVDLLVSHGADPNVVASIDDMETPVEVASAAGHVDVVERLRPLTVRLDWEAASRAGDVAAIGQLLAAGQDIDATDGHGQTALMRASHAGWIEAVGLLIAHGADLDRSAKFGLTALMLAVIQGHDRVARMLAAAGADPGRTGSGAAGFAGKTAADMAAERGDRRLADDLNPHRT